jgi:chorismate-pyruvate lyase
MTPISHENNQPMEGYFKSKGYVAGGVITNSRNENFDIEAVPPFLRVLLVTDGTVTKSLEAFFWETVVVDNLGQSPVTMTTDNDWVGIKKGDVALQREVRLRGTDSNTVYAYAKSLLRLDFLPEQVRNDLLEGRIGIGELLRERGLETYREILDMGREIDENLSPVFETKRCGELLYRTYRVMMKGEPTILITEKFPYRLFTGRT